jgi:signal transduction histidine kinase
MLIVTLGVSAMLLLFYTVFSFNQTENQAARFVMSHVERLAQAGVTSQNVGEIDHEIARFAQTWKATQDLDLRIDIFLNEKQVGHAGQLQPFGLLSTKTDKKLQLPSGDILRVQLGMDLTGFIFYGFSLLIAFEIAVVGLFYILSRSMHASIRAVTQPLESKIAWLKTIADGLPKSARTNATFAPANIAEIDELGESIGSLTQQIVVLEDSLAQINFDRGRLKMAEVVAHSIKGVIATLQLRASEITTEPDRRGIVDCIRTLSDISGNLLKSKKSNPSEASQTASSREPLHILPAITAAIESKRDQYRRLPGVSIQISNEALALGRFARIENAGIQTVLFNLIDNSVESFDATGGQVEVEVSSTDTSLVLNVRDNGRGIPKHIIPSLMVSEFSYGKENGNGMGLSHAKEIVEAIGGSISIDSTEGVGTTVTARLPLHKVEVAAIREISLPAGATLVCVDDDSLIHSTWDLRVASSRKSLGSVVHLHTVAEFEKWMAENGSGQFGSRLYLFDFDLNDGERTGLDLIEDHGIALESILVSGMTTSPDVQMRTAKMGLRHLSKDFIGIVPFHIEEKVSSGEARSVQAI